MKKCVTIAQASVLVNGCPTDQFKLERDLRQGYPLSPFLYLIAAERRNILVQMAVEYNLLNAVADGRERVMISHLQYADDTVFICPGRMENMMSIKYILKNVEAVSGSKVNFSKCSVVDLC